MSGVLQDFDKDKDEFYNTLNPFIGDAGINESDSKKIAAEIDAFNEVCRSVSEKQNTHFIDITFSQREDGGKEEFLANDKLHPSGKEYAKWAAQLSDGIAEEAKK